jgi:uncharacterized RDD family membrane protein YckC
MSCPICGDRCRCAEPRTYSRQALTLDEIDEYDPSEEQFASSLAGRTQPEAEQELASGSLSAARAKQMRDLPDIAPDHREVGPPLTTATTDEGWRTEVSTRIQNYKARRRHSLGDESLSFNFESTAGNHVFLRPEVEPEAETSVAVELAANFGVQAFATAAALEPQYAETFDSIEDCGDPEPAEVVLTSDPPLPPSPPETAKLIFFPKPPVTQQAQADQLADPVFEVPRILEAAEETETVTVPLADITLQPDHDEETCVPYIEPILDLPVPVAPSAQRMLAECVDTLLVLMGVALFGFTASKLGAASLFSDKRALLGAGVLVTGAFWIIYKYLFLVRSGVTPGMQAGRLKLVNFEGERPRRSSRRHRAMAMVISAFPLGLGLLWSFVDTETLCWHDRISKTYLTRDRQC